MTEFSLPNVVADTVRKEMMTQGWKLLEYDTEPGKIEMSVCNAKENKLCIVTITDDRTTFRFASP